ncbi:hypothetical protein PoMZ_10153 [Pyricularia oryzae]|nr:hypothetical protein PoMZ_10153 [Pyricularia oryzae]
MILSWQRCSVQHLQHNIATLSCHLKVPSFFEQKKNSHYMMVGSQRTAIGVPLATTLSASPTLSGEHMALVVSSPLSHHGVVNWHRTQVGRPARISREDIPEFKIYWEGL